MTIREPDFSLSLLPATHRAMNDSQKILFIGQMTDAGSATSGELYTEIGNNNEQDALFGKNSMLATMIRAAKYHNKVSRIDAIPLEDASAGAKASGSIVFTGTPTETGTLTVCVGSKGNISQLRHVYEIGITTSSTPTTIGDALAAAITADTTSAVTAVNTAGSVAITAVHKGTCGNSIGLKVTGSVAGVSVALTGMSSGATNPTLTGLFDVVGDVRYQTVVFPSYVKDEAKAFLDARFNVNKKILDGVGICCITDTAQNIATEVLADNSQSIAVIANKKIDAASAKYVGSGIFELDTIIASEIAAIRALRLTEGVNISQYGSATYGSKDAFGGMHISSKPYFNTILPALPLEDAGRGFTDDELSILTNAGACVIGNNISNTNIIMGTTVTTYKYDNSGNSDVSFKFLEYIDTEVACREYFYVNLRERFAQSRLTNGNVIGGYDMASSQVIAAFITSLYADLAAKTLTRIGKNPETGVEWLTFFKQNLSVTLDLALGKATVYMLLPIVTQLRAIEMTIQVSFSENS